MIVNRAAIGAATGITDYNPVNDQASVTLNGVGTANIGVAKTASTTAPAVGQALTFTIVATNSGPEAAATIEIGDLLGAPFSFLSSQATAGSYEPATGVWTLPALGIGASETLTIVARVLQAGTHGTRPHGRRPRPPIRNQATTPAPCR